MVEEVRNDFFKYRGITAKKLMIVGPPVSGKSTLARQLSELENLPIISAKDIYDFGQNTVS